MIFSQKSILALIEMEILFVFRTKRLKWKAGLASKKGKSLRFS
jgi:hypothetical protein